MAEPKAAARRLQRLVLRSANAALSRNGQRCVRAQPAARRWPVNREAE